MTTPSSPKYLTVKNWREHQHYKNKAGAPPWIKLYRKILTDYDIRSMNEADRFKLIAVWVLAAESEGVIPNDPAYIAGCIGVKRIDLNLLVSRGFLEPVYTNSREALDTAEEKCLSPREVEVEKDLTWPLTYLTTPREGHDHAHTPHPQAAHR